jgi:hypothetical protein
MPSPAKDSALKCVVPSDNVMQFPTMGKKIRDDQISIRIPKTLRFALEAAATDDDHGLSDLVRRVLIDYAAKRIIGAAGTPRPEVAA